MPTVKPPTHPQPGAGGRTDPRREADFVQELPEAAQRAASHTHEGVPPKRLSLPGQDTPQAR